MQYDLFHAYTVDAHTLFVVENLRRFALPRFDKEFPSCSMVMQRLEKPEVAYLAGLFHDIAKGRGGDHSELGAVDAEAFCLEHGMSRYEARLVAWLVQRHLLLSLTAQKKDINDPNVVNEFARTVGDQTHLDYLYVLTVADVRGTNPKIWNSWKESLFAELYQTTRRALRRGVSNPIDKDEFITGRQAQAEQLLSQAGLARAGYQAIWGGSPRSITSATAPRKSRGTRACSPRARARRDHRGRQRRRGARPDGGRRALARGDALVRARDGRARRARPHDRRRAHRAAREIEPRHVLRARERRQHDHGTPKARRDQASAAQSADGQQRAGAQGHAPRAAASAHVLDARADRDLAGRQECRTIVELVAGDRPGLLFQIAKIFDQERVALQNAKILTVGERAEDVFFVTNAARQPLDDQASERLGKALREGLADAPS